MQKICTIEDCGMLNALPQSIKQRILEVITTLDEYYGENRHPDHSLGGYVLLIEREDDLKELSFFHAFSFFFLTFQWSLTVPLSSPLFRVISCSETVTD